jgi:hypothetical protein
MPARQINLDLIFSISQIQQSPQDLHDFLRAYYHVKSADWSANQPMPLKAWQAEVLAVYVAEYARRSRLGHLPVTRGL